MTVVEEACDAYSGRRESHVTQAAILQSLLGNAKTKAACLAVTSPMVLLTHGGNPNILV